MTTQEQHIAIAEACGLRDCNCVDWGAMDHLSSCPASWQQIKNLPAYTTCLNEMHHVEKVWTTQIEKSQYAILLCRMCNGWDGAIHATPAQRAEAWLRVKGKWKD